MLGELLPVGSPLREVMCHSSLILMIQIHGAGRMTAQAQRKTVKLISYVFSQKEE